MEQYRIPEHIRIGTRGSQLALAQTDLFIGRLKKAYPGISCEKMIIKTAGDKLLDRPLLEFGGKAVFVTEFEEAVKEGRIDYAVHSAKDMPMELAEGLGVVCVLPREDARDVLVTRKGTKPETLKEAVIGTGSLRRQLQLAALYPNAVCKSLRGNVPTRLEKLKTGEYDGVILAAAGLKRLGMDACGEYEYTFLEPDVMVPAGGQAIVAIEGRCGSGQEFLKAVTDERAALELRAERLILRKLNAGCHEAVGVYARVAEDTGENSPSSTAAGQSAGIADHRPGGAAAGESAGKADHRPGDTAAGESTGAAADRGGTMHIRLMRENGGRMFRTEGTADLAEWEALAERLTEECQIWEK